MAQSEYILGADDARRAEGTVYLDPRLDSVPATHVLVIGVAAYRSPAFPDVLLTASLSARRLADWFIGSGNTDYANPETLLGSLGVVLSETRDAQRSDYAGGPVPRATFDEVRTAVRAWVQRSQAHKDNLAILYVVGHGESFMNRTAFLLEDYGLDQMDVTAGMAEVEQLTSSLENLRAIRQLLFFDCCRNPTAARLPWSEPLGNKLIALARAMHDHGEPRKQWTVCSTSLREYAYGALNGPTFFNNCLMEGVSGVASDVASSGWPVMPGTLVDRIDQLLSLYRLPDEKQQTPAGRLAGTFPITYAGEFDDIAVYVSLSCVQEWDGCQLDIDVDGVALVSRTGIAGEPPFHRFTAREGQKLIARATRGGLPAGEARATVRPPVCFVKVETGVPRVTVTSAALPAARAVGPDAGIAVIADSPLHVRHGAVVRVLQLPNLQQGAMRHPLEPGAPAAGNPVGAGYRPIDLGGGLDVEVAAGDYRLILQTPDGRTQSKDISLLSGEISTVNFAVRQSPHEWMTAAVVGGKLNRGVDLHTEGARIVTEGDQADLRAPAVGPMPLGTSADAADIGGAADGPLSLQSPFTLQPTIRSLQHLGEIAGHAVAFAICSAVSYDDNGAMFAPPSPSIRLRPAERDARFLRLNVDDLTHSRFLAEREVHGAMPTLPFEHRSAWSPPVFMSLLREDGREELAILPTLGAQGNTVEWQPYVIVDGQAAIDESMTMVVVDSPRWTGLLGFLGARNFEAGSVLLASGLQQSAMAAMEDKSSNPLAAIAGALVAIASADPQVQQKWDRYLLNIANWFPDIPDGPILLGRRLLQRASSEVDIARAHAWLSEGYRRGIPVYSLSLEWLARGLESLPVDAPGLLAQRARVRHIASRVDPRRPFTVLRLR